MKAKIKFYVPVFLIFILSHFSKAQDTPKIITPKSVIPIEVLVGNNRLYNQMIIKRNITNNNKLGVLNISSFSADYKNDISKNEYLSSTALYYTIFKGIGINTGATFNAAEGIKPFIGLQYFYANKTILILYLPSYYYLENRKLSNLVMVEYKPKLSEKWSVYSRLQGFYAYNVEKNSHARSYIYARLGLTYSNYTFGAAINSDWYGQKKSVKDNYGLFLRVAL